MSKNISEEELSLRKRARRRLVGAIVLVVISIIVLPAIFDEPKTDKVPQEVVVNLPNIDRSVNDPVQIPVPPREPTPADPAAQQGNQLSESVPPYDAPFTDGRNTDDFEATQDERKRFPIPGIKPKIDHKRITVVMEAKTPATSATQESSAPANAPSKSAHPNDAIGTAEIPKGGVIIQLGAFSDQAKAKQQLENLVMSGFRAYTESVKTSGGEVTRVRIGPLASRSAAENELKKLNKLGFDGVITSK